MAKTYTNLQFLIKSLYTIDCDWCPYSCVKVHTLFGYISLQVKLILALVFSGP